MISKLALRVSKGWNSNLLVRNLSATNAIYTRHTQRNVSTTANLRERLATKQVQKHDWNRAVSEAEKIVGYPTSFLSLRWLLSDEIANVALHLRKLVGSNHPLLKTAKILLYNGKSTMQAWGLIVLLISKAAGHAATISEMEEDKSAGVLHSQRALAEVTEMIRISHLVHRSLVNLQPITEAAQDAATFGDMTFGNKIGLLSGDYLLGHSCVELASLRNQELTELISSAVRDFAESEFLGDRDEQNMPLPSKPISTSEVQYQELDNYNDDDSIEPLNITNSLGIAEREWEVRHILSSGSLLGKSCQGTLKLAGLSDEIQKQGYLFGKHLSLAWQTCIDLESFQSELITYDHTSFSLVSAPVLFQLEHDPSLYEEIEKGRTSIKNIDFKKIYDAVVQGPGLERTKILQKKHIIATMKVLDKFPATDARTALMNIIVAMQDL